jgi:nucleoside 2-deoxyribosyltransferase
LGFDVFDDWMAAGPEADDFWKKYEIGRGSSYADALLGHAARHVFEFDKYHLDRCDAAVLVLPAGKSGHLELGYVAGTGKPTFILLDGQDTRFDVMYQFATKVFMNKEEMLEYFRNT